MLGLTRGGCQRAEMRRNPPPWLTEHATGWSTPRSAGTTTATAEDGTPQAPQAIAALIRGYTREAGVWGLAAALGAVCARLVRRRAEGDLAPVEVTPQTVAGMLGAPADPHLEVLGRSGPPGVAVGLCRTAARGGEVIAPPTHDDAVQSGGFPSSATASSTASRPIRPSTVGRNVPRPRSAAWSTSDGASRWRQRPPQQTGRPRRRTVTGCRGLVPAVRSGQLRNPRRSLRRRLPERSARRPRPVD